MKRKTEEVKVFFEERDVIVKVVYKQTSYMRMRISKINNITIYSYKKLSEKYILELLNNNKETIFKAWDKIEKNKCELKSNEALLLGKIVNLNEINFDYEYRNTLKLIETLFNDYIEKYNFKKASLQFKTIKSAWGICHVKKNKIVLSTHLTMLPLDLIKYVIIHEFCHFYVPNHSKAFYDKVSMYFPDYKNAKKELRKYSKYF